MKKMILNRLIVTGAFIVIATMSSLAQSTILTMPAFRALPADSTYIADTVSIGAEMPYMVVRDATISGSSLYNPSGFKWVLSNPGASFTSTLNTATIGGSGIYYLEPNVTVKFPNTPGLITLSTTESSSPKFSPTGGCDGNKKDLAIEVIALPSVPDLANVDTAQGGCSAAAPYTVKFTFSAAKYPVYVTC